MTFWMILIILGSVMIIEAIPMIISPSKMKEYYGKISTVDSATLRIIAFVMVLIGLTIVFFVRTKICV